jgi:hypothetical protein
MLGRSTTASPPDSVVTAAAGRKYVSPNSGRLPPAYGQVSGLVVRIAIRVGGQTFHATLTESPAGLDLALQLPQTVEMRDHGAVEKTGRLRAPLSLEGQPPGAQPAVGDVGYYAPGQDFVLYYGEQSYYDGIVVLGRLEGDAAERLARIAGPVTAHIERDGA